MKGVRVLVGTKKGAFILTSSKKRQSWKIDGSALCGLGNLPHDRFSSRSRSSLCLTDQLMVRPGDTAIERWRKDLGNRRQ